MVAFPESLVIKGALFISMKNNPPNGELKLGLFIWYLITLDPYYSSELGY